MGQPTARFAFLCATSLGKGRDGLAIRRGGALALGMALGYRRGSRGRPLPGSAAPAPGPPSPIGPGAFTFVAALGGGPVTRDYSDIGRRRAEHRPHVSLVCAVCGRAFVSYAEARHCSAACRAKAYRERRQAATGYVKRPTRPCPMCGRKFARGRKARYCSPACKQRAVRQRRRG